MAKLEQTVNDVMMDDHFFLHGSYTPYSVKIGREGKQTLPKA